MARARALIVLVGTLVALWSGVGAALADARDVPSENDFVSRVNAERTRAGLPPLGVSADLVDVARRHSADMARSGRLSHNAELSSEVSGWRSLGENVGTGGSVDQVHAAFMGSSVHRSEILDRQFTQVGVGVVWAGDRLWVTQVFREPSASAPAPQPASSSAPAPAPAPAPEPAPAPAPEPAPAPQPAPARQLAAIPPPPAPAPAPAAPAPTPPVAPPPTIAAPTPEPVPVTAAPAPATEVAAEVAGVRRTNVEEAALALPDEVPSIPAPVGVAAGLLAAVVALQGVAVRRLRLA